jgi:hypothetical protein
MLAFYFPLLISLGMLELLQTNMTASELPMARCKQAKPTVSFLE